MPNVYKSCPKIISLEKLKILTPLQNLPNNVRDLGKYIIAKEFEKSCPKSNKSPYLVTLLGMVTLKCKRNLRWREITTNLQFGVQNILSKPRLFLDTFFSRIVVLSFSPLQVIAAAVISISIQSLDLPFASTFRPKDS